MCKNFQDLNFLIYFFHTLKKIKKKKVFCVDPNSKFSRSNKLFEKNGYKKKTYNYLAPNYKIDNISDKKLLNQIKKIKPDFILTNISGGKQEILGLYLKKNLKINTTILCTGAALSFFTKDQAPINNLIDKLYLGWFVRLIFSPSIFLSKYVYGLKLIPMVVFSKIKVIN